MAPIEIRLAVSAGDRQEFVRIPWALHRDDPCWVPPLIADQKTILDPRTGPFYKHGKVKLWIAYRNNRPVGRISSHYSARHDDIVGGAKGYFGFFECENHQPTADALFEAAENDLREAGRAEIEGPFNFTVYDELGVLVDGFETMPAIMVRHNPAYYQHLLEASGFFKSVDWYVYRGHSTTEQLSERLSNVADQVERQGKIAVRNINMHNYDQDAAHVKRLFELAWSQNWGHVAMSDDEFLHGAKGLRSIIIPELSYIVEFDDRPVGIAISVYDVNPLIKRIGGRLFPLGLLRLSLGIKKMKRFRMLLMGVDPRFRGKGFEIAMYAKAIRNSVALKLEEAELSLILENNLPMLQSISHLRATRCKTLRIYKKALAQPS